MSKKGESIKEETSSWLGNGEGAEEKKRRNRIEVLHDYCELILKLEQKRGDQHLCFPDAINKSPL